MFEWKKSAGKIYTLPVESIRPSPFQARSVFDEKELAGLAQSIRENGLLQPISVRKVEGGYELVAGERRLRACKLARMETIPAILCDCGDQRTAALGLLENIQREDLNPFEQAQGLRDVIALWDCTQAEAAKRLGMAQPTLANKLRLLQLTTDQRQFVLDNGLTERHARAVLRLPENRRSEALITIAKRRMNARQTDLYIEHAGVGRLDRPPPLLLVEPSALRAHTPRERGEPAARGNRTAQAGQFQMTVGVDHPRQQDAGIELHASLSVGIAPRIDADDRTVVSERQQRPGPQSRASQQVVRRDPARGGGYRNHRQKS